tara:strand:- start:199 stop:759 length:561 start_codon:yes stop_codon:yes gene_type:complete
MTNHSQKPKHVKANFSPISCLFNMEYAWKEGVRFKTNANDAGVLLEGIRDRFGEITPQLVLKEARHKDSVIHQDFEWNDDKAATLYRLDTARRIIRNLRVVSEGEVTDEPVFVHVTVGDRKYYERTDLAVESPDIWAQVMKEEKTRLEATRNRVKHLTNVEKNGSRIQITNSVLTSLNHTIDQIEV